jgi:hypothetical protein
MQLDMEIIKAGRHGEVNCSGPFVFAFAMPGDGTLFPFAKALAAVYPWDVFGIPFLLRRLFMKTIRNSVLLLAMLSPLALAACGDGYEMRPYENVPYEMERTAGRGIEYVRAGMMPEKGPVLKTTTTEEKVEVKKTETIEQDAPPPVAMPESKDEHIVEEADHIFTSKQRK